MNAALLLIDLQADYLRAPGLQPAAGQVVHAAARAAAACRVKRIPVLHALTSVHRAPDDRMPHWKHAGRWTCEQGTPGHAPPAALAPAVGEPVFHKQFFSAFEDPALHATCQRLNLDTLLLAGVHLHACVRATALDAYRLGYRVIIFDEAVASDDALHAAVTRRYLADRSIAFVPVAAIESLDAPPPRTLTHRSPADPARVACEIPITTAAQVAAQVANATAALRRAFDAARALTVDARAVQLRRLADRLLADLDPLARLITDHVGKPITMSRAEVRRSAALCHATADLAALPLSHPSGPAARYRHVPLGVVAVVTPWNNPLAIPIGKLAPALLFANAVLWKPAPAATEIARRLHRHLVESQLGDLVHLCPGDHTTAAHLAANPNVDAVTLSGSLAAGHALQELCARRHVPFQGELGGNNAAIVWHDADLPRAAREIAAGAFGFAGQRCTANRRAIVPEPLLHDFLNELRQATAALPFGDPTLDATVVGPLISPSKRADVEALLDRARGDDIPLDVPHDRSPGGAYHAPSIATVRDPTHELVQEETFGPVLVVQPATTFDGALDLLNNVRQGLIASLFSDDQTLRDRFRRIAQAGVLKFNRSTVDADAASPLGGWKASGIGPPEHGPCDRDFFTRIQTLYDE